LYFRPSRKGEARRVWRNYWPGAGTLVLAVAIVAAVVWIARGW
jgi:hypothetical protein